jgi:hypothetical protein
MINSISKLYQDTPDFVDGLDGLPGSIKDIADPNAQPVPHFSRENLMLRNIVSSRYLSLKRFSFYEITLIGYGTFFSVI